MEFTKTPITFVENQRSAQRKLLHLYSRIDQVIVIHYSCESFNDSEGGQTPRVSSIACRKLDSGQTKSFSIHLASELPEFFGVNVWDEYDSMEKKLLGDFFSFVREHNAYAYWVHWNMRDIKFGYPLIEHRYKVLGGEPIKISDEKKFDLSRLLVTRYGKRYIGHPRLESIINLNDVTKIDFLSGEEEAAAFKRGEFLVMHQSTLRKVEALSSLLEAAVFRKLKTKAPFWDVHGGSLRLIWEKYIWTPSGRFVSFFGSAIFLMEILFPEAKVILSQWVTRFFGN